MLQCNIWIKRPKKAKKILTRSFAREVFPDSLPYSKRISEELSKLGF